MTAAVKIEGLVKRFGHHTAIDGISFEIPEGSFFGLLGPNGAGKSTLIGAISGLVKPDAGSVAVMGHDVISDYREARRALGLVPQELIDEPFFSIRKLLRIQAGYFGLGKGHWPWIDELLQRLGLWDKRDETMPSLSGGMKRRVLIALALVHKPKVLVLDEPTAGVDIDLRLNLWSFIRELHQQGHTIILTTHYLEEAEQLCEQIAIMREGSLLAMSSPQALLAAHPWQYLELSFQQVVQRLPDGLHEYVYRQQLDKWLIRLPRGAEPNEFLQHAQRAGLQLTGMRMVEASLEDVFRSVTAKEQ